MFQSLKRTENPSARCLDGYRVRENPVYLRYNLLVLEPLDAARSNDARLANCLGSSWAQSPVERVGVAWQVSTSQVLVSFRPSMNLDGARALLSRQGLAIVDATLFEPARIITADTGRAPKESAAVAIELTGLDGIRHAEPSLVIIVK